MGWCFCCSVQIVFMLQYGSIDSGVCVAVWDQ